MSSTADLIAALKAELKASGTTYAQLATQLGLAESSVKRIFSRADMPLSRIDDICRALRLDFAELARRVVDNQPPNQQLSLAQEQAVVSNPKLMLVAICCLSQWTFEQIVATYRVSEAECVQLLARLDKLGVIELRPLNRYRLRVAKTFRWLPQGPVMNYFRQKVVPDYFSGGFEGPGDLLTLVHGSIHPGMASLFNERLQRVAQDFAQQHLADQRLPETQRQPYTLVLGMRSWWFSAFESLKRSPL